MKSKRAGPPDQAELARLHARLADGSPTASADIAELLYEWLLGQLHAAVAYASADDVADVAADALVRYLADPNRFRPERGKGLSGYLLMDARGDLLNLLKSKRQQPAPASLSDAVADRLEDRNIGSMTRERLLEHLPSHLDERVLALLPDQLDRGILELMMDGVHDSDAFAALMGLRQRSREVQAREVKRAKDRIRARLKRGGISRDW
jgi:DNA-directed RNA polymerase specialized sigma24 family protein